MSRYLTVALVLFSFAGTALAQCTGSPNCTVKAAGGGGYTTIQACATAMANGDTCTVFVGTYNEHVTVTSGGVAAYKTLTVNGIDIVNVLDFTISSHVKINGFHIQNPSAPYGNECVAFTSDSTDSFITNNVFYACGSHAMIFEPQTGSNVNHIFIQGNRFSYPCSTSAAPNVCGVMQINGDYHLIENNDFSHVGDGPYLYGAHNVYRRNTFHDVDIADCGSLSSNCHIDFFQADANVAGGSPNTQYMLVEGNTISNMIGPNQHASGLFQAEVCSGQCFNAIVRFNVASHVGSGAITDDNSGNNPPPQAWVNVKVYNNSWIDVNNDAGAQGNGGETHNFSHGSTGGAVLNELFYYPFSLVEFNPYACNGGGTTACSPFNSGSNLAFCAGTPCNLRGHLYGAGAFTDDPGNIKADPLLRNYNGGDFHLSAGSPARGTGTNLTTAVGSGASSTALTVADAGYFQDGSGITGVQADWIRIGASTTVQVSSVNYSTNVITLANAVSWSGGDAIYLYKDSSGNQVLFGSLPDIGAYQFANNPPTSGVAPAVHIFTKATPADHVFAKKGH